MIYINNIIQHQMIKTLFVVLTFVLAIQGFTIEQQTQNSLQGISWPFTLCGKADWTIESLTLAQNPARNINDDIDVLGTAGDDVSFTTVDINVKLNGVFLHNESVDFKKSYAGGETIEFKYQNFVPGFAPAGTYGLTFTFKKGNTANGCLAFSFKLN